VYHIQLLYPVAPNILVDLQNFAPGVDGSLDNY
jgi:hypothetical protein